MAFVSDEHKLVFVHITKTGGTSISVALADAHGAELLGSRDRLEWSGIGGDVPPEYRPGGIEVHSTIREIHDKHPASKNYLSFCVIRNPWERIFSFYQHKKRIEDAALPPGDFAEAFKASNFLVLQPQSWWMRGSSGEIEIDHVVRMENLRDGFAQVMAAAGIDAELPHLNRSEPKCYRDHYDSYSRDLIGEFYRHEIELFGYEF
ncbi:MAG TPA: sulfotransferase family 2 domain-containing protein [Gammaproteobacteria bacterium]|nr:sulfotransferase family 2 domain-containing protein [Gammaproteobacteria bacterium]